jgi:putative peptidoglycan lipid II flippase
VAGQMDVFRDELARAMRLAFLLTIPSTIGLMMLAEPIMSLLYQHGKFTAHQTIEAAGALRFYAIGLGGYAALKVLVNAFYAMERRKTPMMVSFVAVALNLLFNWIFTFRLGWGHRGLAFSTGCVASFNFLFLYVLMRAQLQGLHTRRMLLMLGKVGLASVALIAVCAAASRWLLADWPTQSLWNKGAALLATILVGGAAFVGCGALLRIDELQELLAGVSRRLRR